MCGRLVRSFLAGLALVTCAEGALAQPADPQEERRTTLFKEGRALSDEAKWADAAAKFREVVAIRPAAKALLALAVAERNAGNLVAARRAAKQAEGLARTAGKGQGEELAAAIESIKSTDSRIAAVRLELPSGVSAPEVLVDGSPGLVDEGTLYLDPGAHGIEVRAVGRTPFRAKISVREAERRSLAVALPEAAPAGEGKSDSPSPGAGVPIGPIVLGAAGVAAAGVGAALWGTGIADVEGALSRCTPAGDGPRTCPLDVKPTLEGAPTRVYIGNALVGVGGAAVVGAGIWWLVSRAPASGAPEGRRPAPSWIGGAAPLPGGGLVQVSGRF